jgi:hypothetical protein
MASGSPSFFERVSSPAVAVGAAEEEERQSGVDHVGREQRACLIERAERVISLACWRPNVRCMAVKGLPRSRR